MNLVWPDTLIEIAIISLLALLTRGLLKRLIKQWVTRAAAQAEQPADGLSARAAAVIAKAGGLSVDRQAHRTRTVGTMLGSLVDAVVLVVVVFMILQALGVNIAPALASAGIGGLAIGFGAQSLVKDVISGLFLMLEDQLGVGDHIDIGPLNGTVQSLGLRITRLQDVNGQIWYVRNGEIVTLGNRTQGWSNANISIPVAYSEDPRQVIAILKRISRELEEDPEWADQMLEAPKVLGMTGFEPGQANYLVVVKCPGNQQWAVEREFRARVMTAFQDAGIKAPLVLPATPSS